MNLQIIKNMDIIEFKKFFDMFPKGSNERAYTEARYQIQTKKTESGDPITFELIGSKWKEYIEYCIREKRAEKYIKSLEKFIKDRDYNLNFTASLKLGFLDKYKKQ